MNVTESTVLFVFSFLVTDNPFSKLCCLACYTFLTHFLNEVLPLHFVWMSHKFHVKVSWLSISEPSVATLPLSFVWWSHKFPSKLFHCFQVDTPLCYFFFESLLTNSHNNIVQTVTHFSVSFSVNFLAELFRSSCLTVTQGPYNISSLFPSVNSTLLFSLSHW